MAKRLKKVARKPGKGSLIAQLEADETICQLNENQRSNEEEIRQLKERQGELESLLHDATKRLDEEIHDRERVSEAVTLYREANERADAVIGQLRTEIVSLEDRIAVQESVITFTRVHALQMISRYRRAGTLLGIAHIMEDSAPLAHRGLLEHADKFGFDSMELSVPLREMLRSASRRYEAVALPATDHHLWVFTSGVKSTVKTRRR